MTEQTFAQPVVTLELTEREARYLVSLLHEEGDTLNRRPPVLMAILRKLHADD